VTVHVRSEHPRGRAAVRRLRQRARRFLAELGRGHSELSVLVVGDAAIRRLNAEWRGKDRTTDVLSFPASREGPLLGDVVISLDTAVRAAREENRALGAELDRYLAHGLLHLLGHDHEASAAAARRMATAEDALVGEGMISGTRAHGAAPGRAKPVEDGLPRPAQRGEGRGEGRSGPGSGSRSRSQP
jgi:probable rRNA maturation factor